MGDDTTLEGSTWVLDRTSIESLAPGAPDDARVDLTLRGGRRCRNIGLQPLLRVLRSRPGGSISFGTLGGTEMACEPALMQLESAYLAALGDVRDHQEGGGELVLSGDEVRLVFREEEAPEPVPLVGTTWGLESLALATDAVSSPVAGTDVTLEFLDDGSAAGSGGCNIVPHDLRGRRCIDRVRPGREHEDGVRTGGDVAGDGGVRGAGVGCLVRCRRRRAHLHDADGGFLVSFRASP